jgi:predicted nucleic acid-binding protein
LDRVFLDANVLFSAAWRADSGLLRLWRMSRARLLTSAYALAEARRNLEEPGQLARLERLVQKDEITPDVANGELPESVELPDKDRPILLAAIAGGATHLLTGDVRHFGSLYGRTVCGILVLAPADYLRPRARRAR